MTNPTISEIEEAVLPDHSPPNSPTRGTKKSKAAESAEATSDKKQVFICEQCAAEGVQARYSRIEYLHRHQRTHTAAKPFTCEFCNKSYARSDVLFRHRRKCNPAHNNGEAGPSTSRTDATSKAKAPSKANAPASATKRSKRARKEARPYPELDSAESPASSQSQSSPVDAFPAGQTVFSAIPTVSTHSSSNDEDSPGPQIASSKDSATDTPATTENPESPTNIANIKASLAPDPLEDFFAKTSIDPETVAAAAAAPPTLEELAVNDFFDLAARARNNGEQGIGNGNAFANYGVLPWEVVAWRREFDKNSIVPEQTMMSVEHELFRKRVGKERLDPSNPFYFNPNKLVYCYMIPRWNMPKVVRMSAMAYRTFNQVFEHLGVFHMPTFTLDSTHTWIAFAMCTTAPRPESNLRHAPETSYGVTPQIQEELNGVDMNSEWAESQDVIRREKTDILVKAFYQTAQGRKLTAEEALPLIHSLLLYNSTSFLSEDQGDRLAGELFLATIISVARQSGVFHPGSDCTQPGRAPTADWELHWRKWITHESWRRTAWLVYTLDSLASLESNAVANLSARELRHIPVPAPQSAWNARTNSEWVGATMSMAETVVGISLEACMTCLADPTSSKKSTSPLHTIAIGPYARHVLILTVLRGIVAYGQGKPKGGYVTRRWVLGKRNAEASSQLDPLQLHTYIICAYSKMLDNWRRGWDFDFSCALSFRGVHFVNDALPAYWLCRSLLETLAPIPPPYVPFLSPEDDDGELDEDGPNRLVDVDLKHMFFVARQFVSNGEGLGLSMNGLGTGNLYMSANPLLSEDVLNLNLSDPSIIF